MPEPATVLPDACDSRSGEARWIGLVAALGALAGRLTLIRDFGTSLPYQDQWRTTAADILEPWVNGRLSYRSFFEPVNDHWAVLGRMYSFVLTLVNGQWNNLAETTGNALLYAAIVFVLVKTITPALGRLGALGLALGAGFVLGLPFSWENTLLGAQTNLILQIGLSIAYLRAVAVSRECSLGWWLGQLAGGMVLFTMRSGVLVFAPAAALLLLRLFRGDGKRTAALAGLALAAGWVFIFFLTAPAFAETAGMSAGAWQVWLEATLRQLGWPLSHPGWVLLMYLPGVWFALDRLPRRLLSGADSFVLLLGAWVAAQALAIGFARGDVTTGFVSRYCDFLALGLVANGACLAALARTSMNSRARAVLVLLTVVWLAGSLRGLWHESVSGHAYYNLEGRLVTNAANLAAVRGYVGTGNPQFLAAEKIGETLYSYPPTLLRLLDQPGFRALLPPETGAAETRPDYGRLGAVLIPGLRFGPGLAVGVAGVIILCVLLRRSPPETPVVSLPPSPWTFRQVLLPGLVTTSLIWGALLAWEKPFLFNAPDRWSALMSAVETGAELPPLDFSSTVGRPVNARELRGAVSSEPDQIQPFLYGTLLGGLNYTGIVCSPSFMVHRRFLTALVTGWPNWPGNAIRWQVENPATGEKSWLPVLGNPLEPGNNVRLWTVPMERYQGWRAQLFLFDGTTDAHGWVGISQPVATDDPDFGTRWIALQHGERAESTHRLLAVLAALAALVWIAVAGGFWSRLKMS